MALPLALIVLTVVSALVGATLYVAVQDVHINETAGPARHRFDQSETGAFGTLSNWDPLVYNFREAYPADSVSTPAAEAGGDGTSTRTVLKLNGELYFIHVVSDGAGARRSIGLLARVRPLHPSIQAALSARHGSALSGPVTINGADGAPPTWRSCGEEDSSKAGLSVGTDSVVVSGAVRIEGSPPVLRGSMTSSPGLPSLGEISYGGLAAVANLVVSGGPLPDVSPAVVYGHCNEAVSTNWGDGSDQTRPCGGYFPVVHVLGSAAAQSLDGQGILLVDGDLSVGGGMRWFGLVLVQGSLVVRSSAPRDVSIWGATLIGGTVLLEGDTRGGSLEVHYSKCAITKALESVALPEVLGSRGWVQLQY